MSGGSFCCKCVFRETFIEHEFWITSLETTGCMFIRFVYFYHCKNLINDRSFFWRKNIFLCFSTSTCPGSRASNKSRRRVCTWFDLQKVIATTRRLGCVQTFFRACILILIKSIFWCIVWYFRRWGNSFFFRSITDFITPMSFVHFVQFIHGRDPHLWCNRWRIEWSQRKGEVVWVGVWFC